LVPSVGQKVNQRDHTSPPDPTEKGMGSSVGKPQYMEEHKPRQEKAITTTKIESLLRQEQRGGRKKEKITKKRGFVQPWNQRKKNWLVCH